MGESQGVATGFKVARIPDPPQGGLIASAYPERSYSGTTKFLIVKRHIDAASRVACRGWKQDLEADLVANVERPVWVGNDCDLVGRSDGCARG